MIHVLLIPRVGNLDWPSLAWVATIGGLTLACLRVRAKFQSIAAHGRTCAFLAHVVVGYFSVAMVAFGGWSAAEARFPVPGGTAWEGPVAVIGGLAALMVGACTLYEHVMMVVSTRRVASLAAVKAR